MRPYLLVIVILIVPLYSSGQNKEKWGVLIEHGVGGHQLAENLNYKPWIIGMVRNIPIHQWNERWAVGLEGIPNFGFERSDKTYIEIGLNARAWIEYRFSLNWSAKFKLASGPHWINVKSERQASGFIFSDYFIFSLKSKMERQSREIYMAYRHLSNLSFKQPNGGINNIILGLMFYW